MSKLPDSIFISIVCADDSVAIMQFVTCEYDKDDSPRWARPPSSTNIEAEIAKTARAWDAAKRPIQRWRVVRLSDLPPDRTHRHAWRDNGIAVAVDSTLI